jgi:hypothetical protein
VAWAVPFRWAGGVLTLLACKLPARVARDGIEGELSAIRLSQCRPEADLFEQPLEPRIRSPRCCSIRGAASVNVA